MKKEMWLIWKSVITRRRFIVGKLTENDGFFFSYVAEELPLAQKNGFDCFPGFEDLEKTYYSKDLFINIETRLPNPLRPDYEDILRYYDLNIENSKMEILMKTKGRLLTDNYEFVPVFDPKNLNFEIAGTSHCEGTTKYKDQLKLCTNFLLILDDNNPYDENSIKIMFVHGKEQYHVGYVPRYYSKELSILLRKNISYEGHIEKLRLNSLLSDENITVSLKLIFD